MIEPSLALQATIRARLSADASVTDLVPADAILDRNTRPERFPCIIIGEGQTIPGDDYSRFHETVYADLHIWTEGAGLTEVKAIAGAIRAALRPSPWAVQDHRCHALVVANARYMRDPAGALSHGVVSVEAILQEVAA